MTLKQKKDAVSCMDKVACSDGDLIIKQGDEGDKFYIVDSGTFDVKVRDDEGVMQTVFNYETPGSAFGEVSEERSKEQEPNEVLVAAIPRKPALSARTETN